MVYSTSETFPPDDLLAGSNGGNLVVRREFIQWTQNWWKRDGSGIYSLVGPNGGGQQYQLFFTPISRPADSRRTVENSGILLPIGFNPDRRQGEIEPDEFPDGRILIVDMSHPDTNAIIDPSACRSIYLTHSAKFAIRRSSPFSNPTLTYEAQAALSPDGKRIAWTCDVQSWSWLSVLIHDMLKVGRLTGAPNTCEVCVTDLTGRHERLIAWVPGAKRGESIDQLRRLKWLPDGRSVSVLYRDKLYIIPAGSQ